ncbi:MAG: nuclear transport factor 2 family protein [Rhodospirillaceae bacterium]|nr:nuclear transport factor 2 family protein [Rhodospirillaceae bacterium]
MSEPTIAASADAYIAFYEGLSRASVVALDTVAADDIVFTDPFNQVHGRDRYAALLLKMFDAVPDIRFAVSHRAFAGDTCFIRWRSAGTLKALGGAPWVVEGMSELRFAPDGRVREHIDHWDAAAQFYERLPVIGAVLRLIRRRVSAH